jgi:hypothetical protein
MMIEPGEGIETIGAALQRSSVRIRAMDRRVIAETVDIMGAINCRGFQVLEDGRAEGELAGMDEGKVIPLAIDVAGQILPDRFQANDIQDAGERIEAARRLTKQGQRMKGDRMHMSERRLSTKCLVRAS